METCTNCGAQLRAGAKFCTSCGARQNLKPEVNSGWDTQQTQVIRAITPEQPAPEPDTTEPAPRISRSSNRFQEWGRAEQPAADDPASRFISALESEVKPIEEPSSEPAASEPETEPPAHTWVTPAPTAFTPPTPVTWNWSAGDDEKPEAPATEEVGDTWPAPASWSASEPALEPADDTAAHSEEPDASGFTEGGDTEVDYLSGDENIDVSGHVPPVITNDPVLDDEAVTVTTQPDDSRAEALRLIDDLRRVVRLLPSTAGSASGSAAMTLTEASINADAFDDVRDAINTVQEDPRDIQALSELAAKVDRIEALLQSHQALQDAIERAIGELD